MILMILHSLNANQQLYEQSNYLTANEPEQRVAHIPPIVAPGPVCQQNEIQDVNNKTVEGEKMGKKEQCRRK